MSSSQTEQCGFCRQSFPSRDELMRHKAITDRHPYCLICDRDFKIPGGIRAHVEQLHGTPKLVLPCPTCGCKYSKASDLMAHLERNEFGCSESVVDPFPMIIPFSQSNTPTRARGLVFDFRSCNYIAANEVAKRRAAVGLFQNVFDPEEAATPSSKPVRYNRCPPPEYEDAKSGKAHYTTKNQLSPSRNSSMKPKPDREVNSEPLRYGKSRDASLKNICLKDIHGSLILTLISVCNSFSMAAFTKHVPPADPTAPYMRNTHLPKTPTDEDLSMKSLHVSNNAALRANKTTKAPQGHNHDSNGTYASAASYNENPPCQKPFKAPKTNDYETQKPLSAFHVRPAKKSDLEQITMLYNKEVERGGQTIDTYDISANTFHKLHMRCLQVGLPFLVAVSSPTTQQRQSHENSVWTWLANVDNTTTTSTSSGNSNGGAALTNSVHVTEHADQPSTGAHDCEQFHEQEAKVLGFAFVMPLELGHETTWEDTTARISVRLYALVEPTVRRNGLGAALVSRCLGIVSGRVPASPCTPGVEYINCTSKILNVFVDVLVDRQNDQHHRWITDFLASLCFTQMAFLPSSHKTRRGPTSKLLSKAVFHHQCRQPRDILHA